MDPRDFAAASHRFLAWFRSLEGATFHQDLQIADLTHRNAGRGIIATRDIPAETILFTIPRSAILGVSTSSLSQKLPELWDGSMAQDPETSLGPWPSLILVMMYEYLQGDKSIWKPYFDILPQDFDTPMFWSDTELAELQASPLVGKIGKPEAGEMFRSKVVPHRRILAADQADLDDVATMQLAHRMASTIMAYAFDLENLDDAEEEGEDGWVEDKDELTMLGMVPMADILNSDAEFNAHVNHGEESLSVTSLRPIGAGEEVLNYYGPHPNSELLRRYGYVTSKHSRYDVVEIGIDIVEECVKKALNLSADTWAQKTRVDPEELDDAFVFERESGTPDSTGTIHEPAEFQAPPEELEHAVKELLRIIKHLDPAAVPDKRKRDGIIKSVILASLKSKQAEYPTTIQEDEALLSSSGVSGRRRMAIEVRLGEKKLLEEAISQMTSRAADDEGNDEDEPSAKRKK